MRISDWSSDVCSSDLVHGGGVKLPAGNLATTLPAVPAAALIDDFERADGRSSLDTLGLTDMDGGVERSSVVPTASPMRAATARRLPSQSRCRSRTRPRAAFSCP